MKRRQILLSGLGLSLVAAQAPLAFVARAAGEAADVPDSETGLFADDRTLGNPEAKAVLIEYASLSCPHCATFHTTVMPSLKSEWIEPGKLLYVYRDFPLNAPALWAAMLANCLEGDAYFAFLDVLYKNQPKWLSADDPAKELFKLSQLAGFDQARFDQCVNDEAEFDRIVRRLEYAQKTYDITGTPTVILNGKKVDASYDALAPAIAAIAES